MEKTVNANLKADLYVELAQLVSAVILVGFLWTHMLFLAVILFGIGTFDQFAAFLDRYWLSYLGIPVVIIAAVVHVFAVCRRIPTRYREFWRHVRLINHTDTWIWVFQLFTALGVGALASIHVASVLTGWPIRALQSADRIHTYWWFYLLLLIFGEYHAGFGLYRVFVKWGWINRHTVSWVTKTVSAVIFGLGLVILWVFTQLGGAM